MPAAPGGIGRALGRLAIRAAAGLLASLAVAWFWRGGTVHRVAAIASLAGCLVVLALQVFILSPRGASRPLRRDGFGFDLVAAALAIIALSWPPGVWLHGRDIRAAKAYCERLLPFLEASRGRAGAYPPTLPDAGAAARRPRLLREGLAYETDGRSYEIRFRDRAAPMAVWIYSSRAGGWRAD